MRLCRFVHEGRTRAGFFFDEAVVPFDGAARAWGESTHGTERLSESTDLVDFLPPEGQEFPLARKIGRWLADNPGNARKISLPLSEVELLAPVPRPPKLFLLAGNYAAHIQEGGGTAIERARTFPYVFMKPPTTTIQHPDRPVTIPAVSPDHIDWEVELGVVIGRRASRVPEGRALEHVAGYTVINDISDRKFRPNPGRSERPKDSFFDWLHGKWHDGFCPMGPCVLSADAVPDPQKLRLVLTVNGETKQDASTAQQIFSVAAVIEFISSFVTLEPGDVISTGTPSGVGNATGTYLKPGDRVAATIDGIGTLRNPMVADKGR